MQLRPVLLLGCLVRTRASHTVLTRIRGGSSSSSSSSSRSSTIPDNATKLNVVYLGLGTNLGDRHANILNALRALNSLPATRVDDTSMLYETAPMYVEDQPRFLNAACRVRTALDPGALLAAIKGIERDLGREQGGLRFGPRPIDVDILLFSKQARGGDTAQVSSAQQPFGWVEGTSGHAPLELELPHPRLREREFVLRPLLDILRGEEPLGSHLVTSLEETLGSLGEAKAVAVLPLRGELIPLGSKAAPRVMGILNATPDSFSDGGQWAPSELVDRGVAMALEGAALVDVGGESTRPGAGAVAEEEELRRVVPVVRGLRLALDERGLGHVAISVDTRSAKVAAAAVGPGMADAVNDVSAGAHDPRMRETVADLGCPVMAMHMRGDPATMTTFAT